MTTLEWRLVYNPKSTEHENPDMGMKDLVVRTVPQKPDIVLQLTKNDLQQGMKMTYLFDAKYRIADRQNGVDTPPDDAINQMHRYRDAIYYKDLHFFMPYIKGEGIRDVYEIVKVRTITAKEAKQTEGEKGKDDLRLAFELQFVRKQYADIQPINTDKLINYTFIDTTFDGLDDILKTN